jgi:hypothetical protein
MKTSAIRQKVGAPFKLRSGPVRSIRHRNTKKTVVAAAAPVGMKRTQCLCETLLD